MTRPASIRQSTLVSLGILLLVPVLGDSIRAQSAGPRAFVLDADARTLSTIDVASGAVVRTASLQGSPGLVVRGSKGKRLVVFDRGTGRDAGEAGFQAKTKSAVTVVDAATLEVQSRIELGSGLEPTPMFDASGDRLAVICPGYAGKNPQDSQPRELVTVDIASGRVAGRIPLPRPATAFFGTPDGRMAIVLSARDKPKQTPPLAAELRFIDLAGPTVLGVLTFEGNPQNPVLAPDGKFVYLLDRGNPSGNADKNVNGRLHIISTEDRKSEPPVDVGSGPRGFVLDEAGRQYLLLSDSAPVKGGSSRDRSGQLRIIRGANIVGPIAVPYAPISVAATTDNKRIFVVSTNAVTGCATPEFTPLSSTEANGIGFMQPAVSPDGRRAFGVSQQNLYTYDLVNGKQLEKITTGRMSTRILLAAEAVALTESSRSAGRREAERKGKSHYYYTQYNLKDANETIAVRPDSKAVYALNQQTADVTIVDSDTGTVIEKIGASGSSIRFLPGGGVALVIDGAAVHAIDLATNKKLEDLGSDKYASFSTAEVSPDGKYAVVYGPQAVLSINGSTGKAAGRVAAFRRVVDVELDW